VNNLIKIADILDDCFIVLYTLTEQTRTSQQMNSTLQDFLTQLILNLKSHGY